MGMDPSNTPNRRAILNGLTIAASSLALSSLVTNFFSARNASAENNPTPSVVEKRGADPRLWAHQIGAGELVSTSTLLALPDRPEPFRGYKINPLFCLQEMGPEMMLHNLGNSSANEMIYAASRRVSFATEDRLKTNAATLAAIDDRYFVAYKVKPGDSWASISKKTQLFGVSAQFFGGHDSLAHKLREYSIVLDGKKKIMAEPGGILSEQLQPGQIIKLPTILPNYNDKGNFGLVFARPKAIAALEL